MNNKYVSPINGIVEEIIPHDNKFTLKIANDFIEIVLVDLDRVYKKTGETVKTGEEIGEDNNITVYTKFAIIQYNNAQELPQFNNNKLHFISVPSGAPIHSMESGIATFFGYEESRRGSYIEVTNFNKAGFVSRIQYWHLLASRVRMGEIIEENKIICYSGNTGATYEPQLTVFFTSYYDDLRAIYVKNKAIIELDH